MLGMIRMIRNKNFSSRPANPKLLANYFLFHALLLTYADGAIEKQLWAGQTLSLTVYHFSSLPPSLPPSAAHHCLACTSQE